MANMSYCRFRNTNIDMEDCIDALKEIEYDDEEISEEEAESCVEMFDSIIEYLDGEGLLKNFDYDAFEEWKQNVKKWSEK